MFQDQNILQKKSSEGMVSEEKYYSDKFLEEKLIHDGLNEYSSFSSLLDKRERDMASNTNASDLDFA